MEGSSEDDVVKIISQQPLKKQNKTISHQHLNSPAITSKLH